MLHLLGTARYSLWLFRGSPIRLNTFKDPKRPPVTALFPTFRCATLASAVGALARLKTEDN